jgi:DNA-binding LytR/AlgR family response regulator
MDPHRFFRISRSCILAEDAVDSVTKLVGSRLRVIPSVKFKGNLDLTVSRARVDAFLDWLQDN